MIQICVLAIAGLFAALVIKKDKPEFEIGRASCRERV